MGKCCSIPKKYVVASEVYESNDFEGAEEWIRSQRSGRESTGYMFHGPIRLRFDGGWYVAVICLGEEKDDGTCDCDTDPEIYDCTETDDPGFCYYLAGIPGLGAFDEGENCDCGGSGGDDQANTSQGCDKCGDTFAPCELGCPEECSCCWKIPPAEGPEGVACSEFFQVIGYEDIKEHYPEILQNKYCQFPIAALQLQPDSTLGRLMKHLKDFHLINPGDVTFASFRGPDDECRVELWARCSCEGCGSGPKPKSYIKEPPKQLVPEFPGIKMGCACKEAECAPECYDAEDLNVDVVDEWQALEIGGIWTNKTGDSCDGDPCSLCWDCDWWPVPPSGRLCTYEGDNGWPPLPRPDGTFTQATYGYATLGEKQLPVNFPVDGCVENQEWLDAGGYDQYARWRWGFIVVRGNYWNNNPDWATLEKHYDSRVIEYRLERLWVCEGKKAKWRDATADAFEDPDCFKTEPDVRCEGWRLNPDGTIEECDSDAEDLEYYTEVAEVPVAPPLPECDEKFETLDCPDTKTLESSYSYEDEVRKENPLP